MSFLKKILSFASSFSMPAWVEPAAIVLLISTYTGFVYVHGDEHGTEKLTEYIGKEATATVKLQAARERVVVQIETKYRTRIQTVTVKGDTIIKEVPVYVTKSDDAGCTVPVGFVRSFNSAWAGEPAGPASELDRGSSGVALSTVAEVEANNAKSCRTYKEQRDGLIEFYRGLQAVDKQ